VTPAFAHRTGAANPLDGLGVGGFTTAALGDLDADGDLDLVSGQTGGTFVFFVNTGSAVSPAFVQLTGGANPFDGLGVSQYSIPALEDLDADGDLDLVSGDDFGVFHYYENTGDATSPAFVERTGGANPLDGFDVGLYSAPALHDLDGDGDADLVSGETSGFFFYFENTGDATSPAFVASPASANPLAGESPGGDSTLAIGDLDGDGRPDAVTGTNSGSFRTTYLPEPGEGVLLGAGLALLRWLDRRRRRREAREAQDR